MISTFLGGLPFAVFAKGGPLLALPVRSCLNDSNASSVKVTCTSSPCVVTSAARPVRVKSHRRSPKKNCTFHQRRPGCRTAHLLMAFSYSATEHDDLASKGL